MTASRRASRARALLGLADRVLEAPDLAEVSRLLTRELPDCLGLGPATLLLWDRRLETFQAVLPGEHWVRPLQPGQGVPAPEARHLLSGGALIETSGGDDGLLVPLLARSGLVGMLVLGPPRRPGRTAAPVAAGNLRALSALQARAAVAVENHLYQSELIASERMAALGTMAGMLAHDFRGPLTVIRGYAEMVAAEAEEPALVRERAAVIVRAADRLERMTAETLDFARVGGRVPLRPLRVADFLEDVAANVAHEFPALRVERSFSVPAGATALIDADKMQRAVGNIAANALDAMRGQGTLHIEARVEGTGTAARLVLTLADEGPGVPAAIRDRIFDAFVTSGKKGGTGLGLAIARRFVEDHGGRLDLLDEGPGARFRLLLPLHEAAAS